MVELYTVHSIFGLILEQDLNEMSCFNVILAIWTEVIVKNLLLETEYL
jgi:hypothetical protein